MAGAEGFEPPLAVLETAGLPLNLRPFSGDSLSPTLSLLDFLMRLVLAALTTELAHFQPIRIVLLVLDGRVVALLTGLTLQGDDRG